MCLYWLTYTHVLWLHVTRKVYVYELSIKPLFFLKKVFSLSSQQKSFVILYSTWAAKEGPKRDSYNISDNPQFRLEIRANQPAAVWILLTRHITDKVRTSVSLCLFVIVNGTLLDYVRS